MGNNVFSILIYLLPMHLILPLCATDTIYNMCILLLPTRFHIERKMKYYTVLKKYYLAKKGLAPYDVYI